MADNKQHRLEPKPIEETDSLEVKLVKYQLENLNLIEDAINKALNK